MMGAPLPYSQVPAQLQSLDKVHRLLQYQFHESRTKHVHVAISHNVANTLHVRYNLEREISMRVNDRCFTNGTSMLQDASVCLCQLLLLQLLLS